MDRKLTFLLIGGVYWGIGVTAIDILGPLMLGTTGGKAMFFLSNGILAALSIVLIAKLTGRTRHDMLLPVVIMSLAAMVLDAVSLSFVPAIYPVDPAIRVHVGASLLFFFWSFLFFALLWHRAPANQNREV